VLIDYKCDNLKGHFPHGFMDPLKLNYIGLKPDFKFYENNISKKEYDLIPQDN
jgi:hypothetical protein